MEQIKHIQKQMRKQVFLTKKEPYMEANKRAKNLGLGQGLILAQQCDFGHYLPYLFF